MFAKEVSYIVKVKEVNPGVETVKTIYTICITNFTFHLPFGWDYQQESHAEAFQSSPEIL
jgi:hypothetical protein